MGTYLGLEETANINPKVRQELTELRARLEQAERGAAHNGHALNLCTDEKLAAWREIKELKRERDEVRALLREADVHLEDASVDTECGNKWRTSVTDWLDRIDAYMSGESDE